jgi:hypothetical protein
MPREPLARDQTHHDASVPALPRQDGSGTSDRSRRHARDLHFLLRVLPAGRNGEARAHCSENFSDHRDCGRLIAERLCCLVSLFTRPGSMAMSLAGLCCGRVLSRLVLGPQLESILHFVRLAVPLINTGNATECPAAVRWPISGHRITSDNLPLSRPISVDTGRGTTAVRLSRSDGAEDPKKLAPASRPHHQMLRSVRRNSPDVENGGNSWRDSRGRKV